MNIDCENLQVGLVVFRDTNCRSMSSSVVRSVATAHQIYFIYYVHIKLPSFEEICVFLPDALFYAVAFVIFQVGV